MSHLHHRTGQRPIAIPLISRTQALKRRSVRLALNAAVTVSGEDRRKCAFTMGARATNLNKHGAAIQLNRELSVGSAVAVRNARGEETSARVVGQVSSRQGVHTYGIEFEDGVRDFWGISFPTPA